jgi:uncharacterized protein
MEFEWDAGKAATNRRKHGVSFDEACEVFGDRFALTGDDTGHSSKEHRDRTVGKNGKERVLVVISTRRNGATRIISARRATAREARAYEKEIEPRLGGER